MSYSVMYRLADYEEYRGDIEDAARNNPRPFNDWFGGKERVYLPFYADSQGIDDNVAGALDDFGCTITDYRGGYCQRGSQTLRISKALEQAQREALLEIDAKNQRGEIYDYEREVNETQFYFEEVMRTFVESKHRVDAARNQYYVVISQNPNDIGRMSTDQEWTSCMELGEHGGSHQGDVYCEVASGGLVAYLVREEGANFSNPFSGDIYRKYLATNEVENAIARIYLRRFENRQGNSIVIPEQSTYGNDVQGFRDVVNQWVAEHQGDATPGWYTRQGGEYSDSFGEGMLVAPKNPNDILKWLRGEGEDAVFSTWSVQDNFWDYDYNDQDTPSDVVQKVKTREEAEAVADQLNAEADQDDSWRQEIAQHEGDEWMEFDEDTGEFTHQRYEVKENKTDHRRTMINEAQKKVLTAPRGTYPIEIVEEVIDQVKQETRSFQNRTIELVAKYYPEYLDNFDLKKIDKGSYYQKIHALEEGPEKQQLIQDEVDMALEWLQPRLEDLAEKDREFDLARSMQLWNNTEPGGDRLGAARNVASRWFSLFSTQVMDPLGSLYSDHKNPRPLPEGIVQKLVDFAINTLPNYELPTDEDLSKMDQSIGRRRGIHYTDQARTKIAHLFSMSGADSPTVQNYYKALLPSWGAWAVDISSRHIDFAPDQSSINIDTLGYPIARLGENGRQFLPFLKEKAEEAKKILDYVTENRDYGTLYSDFAKKNLEKHYYVIETLERGRPSGKYRFSYNTSWQYKFAETKVAGIPIKTMNGTGELVAGPESASQFTTFEYQWPGGYTDINLQALALNDNGLQYSVGYVAINGPVNWNPVDPVDQHFLTAIQNGLKGFAKAEWAEGRNPFLDMMEQATGKRYTDNPDEVNMTEFEETEVLPLPQGITMGQSSTIDVIGPYPNQTHYYIQQIIRLLENAAKPLIENNTLDFYGYRSQGMGENHVWSQRGQQEKDDHQANNQRHIGYWLYVVNTYLAAYPNCKKRIEYLAKRYMGVEPSNVPVDLKNSEPVKYMIDEAGSHVVVEIHNAMIAGDDDALSRMEHLLQTAEKYKINGLDSLLFLLNREDFLEALEIYMYEVYASAPYQQFMRETGYEMHADYIMEAAREQATTALQNRDQRTMRKWYKYINDLGLPPEVVQQYDQAEEQFKEEDFLAEKQRKEQARVNSFNLHWDKAIIDLTDPAAKVQDISRYDGLGEYLVANDQYGEGTYMDAYERAEEKAREELEERPSETYSENEEEILSDIKFEADDYLEATAFWETDAGEKIWKRDNLEVLHKDYDAMRAYEIKFVLENLRDEFVDWKIGKLKEEEEQESWKYEVTEEAIEEALRGDMYRGDTGALHESAEAEAYELGMMYMSADTDADYMEVWVHPKYAEQAKAALQTFAQQNKPSDNWDDPGLPKHFEIDVSFYGTEDGYQVKLYDLLYRSAGWKIPFSKTAQEQFFHGTKEDFVDPIQQCGFEVSTSGGGQRGLKGVWITTDQNNATAYAKCIKEGGDPVVLRVQVKPGLNIANLAEAEAEKQGFDGTVERWNFLGLDLNNPEHQKVIQDAQPFAMTKLLQKAGYDGAWIPNTTSFEAPELVIFDPANIVSIERHASSKWVAKYAGEPGQCFRDAGKYIMDNNGVLVHGLVTNPIKPKPFWHAWIETDDKVYDCTLDQEFDRDRYYELFSIDPTKLIKYEQSDAMIQMVRNRHWGPWHEGFEIEASTDDIIKAASIPHQIKSGRRTVDEIEQWLKMADAQDHLQQLGAPPDVIDWIMQQKNPQFYIGQFTQNPGFGINELSAIQPRQRKRPIKQKETPFDPKDMKFVERMGYQDPFKTWVLVQLRKWRAQGRLIAYHLFDEIADWQARQNIDITSYSFEQAQEESDAWHDTMAGMGEGKIYEPTAPDAVVYSPTGWEGWSIQKVTSENDLLVEGNIMDHCVGDYCNDVIDNKIQVYSLRDPKNGPHVTIGIQGDEIFQCQGKGNSDPKPEYKEMLKEWFTVLRQQNPNLTMGNEEFDFSPLRNVENDKLDEQLHNIVYSGDEYGFIPNLSDLDIESAYSQVSAELSADREYYRRYDDVRYVHHVGKVIAQAAWDADKQRAAEVGLSMETGIPEKTGIPNTDYARFTYRSTNLGVKWLWLNAQANNEKLWESWVINFEDNYAGGSVDPSDFTTEEEYEEAYQKEKDERQWEEEREYRSENLPYALDDVILEHLNELGRTSPIINEWPWKVDAPKQAQSRWSHKFATKMFTDQVVNHIHQAITNYIDGDWEIISARRLMPSYRLQKYGVVEMMGRNVKAEGDAYYVKVFYEVRKKRGEIDYPPGYFADDNPPGGKYIGHATSPERAETERRWQHPYEDAEYYDSELGHQLLSFRGFIEGWKGPNGPQHDEQERLFLIGPDDPRHNMVEIGRFGTDVVDRGDDQVEMREINPADTPFAVAETVRDSIDRFWSGGDNEFEDPVEPVDPTESAPTPAGAPVLSENHWTVKYAQQLREISFTLIGNNLEWSRGYHQELLTRNYGIPGGLASLFRNYLPRGSAVDDIEDGYIVEASKELKPYVQEIASQLNISPMRIGFDNGHYIVVNSYQYAAEFVEGFLMYEEDEKTYQAVLNFLKSYLPQIYELIGPDLKVEAQSHWQYKFSSNPIIIPDDVIADMAKIEAKLSEINEVYRSTWPVPMMRQFESQKMPKGGWGRPPVDFNEGDLYYIDTLMVPQSLRSEGRWQRTGEKVKVPVYFGTSEDKHGGGFYQAAAPGRKDGVFGSIVIRSDRSYSTNFWETLRHEVVHALDPKTGYETEYRHTPEYLADDIHDFPTKPYYNELTEFDARTSEIYSKIVGMTHSGLGQDIGHTQFLPESTEEVARNIKSTRDLLARIRNNVVSGNWEYITQYFGGNKPGKDRAIKYWSTDPRLKRKLFQRTWKALEEADKIIDAYEQKWSGHQFEQEKVAQYDEPPPYEDPEPEPDPQEGAKGRFLPNDEIYDELGMDRPSLGDRVYEKWGIWQYPFQKVKKDVVEGWYLDWFDYPGSIHKIESVQVGDKVGDDKLNMTPYWEVSGIDEDKGRIYVNPIEPNPWLTGVGAGGHKFTEHDFDVQSGAYEQGRIDDILDRINKKLYTDPGDVAYMLLGTVPVHNGPNGAQGGWYNLTDWHNRGHQKGMSPQEIMMKDSAMLQKLGLAVPPTALDGTMPPDVFKYVMDGGLPYISSYDDRGREERKMLQIEGENFEDPEAMKNMILTHPQPSIKKRNWQVLQEMWHGPWDGKSNLSRSFFKDLISKFASVHHPKQEQISQTYDPYEYIKEQMIGVAMQNKWSDVIPLFEGSVDTGNRSEVARAYSELGQIDDIIRLEENEAHPKVLKQILYYLHKNKVKGSDLIDRNPEKYRAAIQSDGSNSVDDYHRKELAKSPVWVIDKSTSPEETSYIIDLMNGALLSVEQYLNKKHASSRWSMKFAR